MNVEDCRTRSAPVIAVLPFEAGEPHGALARALALELTGELARFGGLEVIAPASAAAVAGLPEAEAAGRLDADYLLSGRLVGLEDRAEVSVTLAARDAKTVWQEKVVLLEEAPVQAVGTLVARVAATFSAQVAGDVARRAQMKPPASRADFERIAHAVSMLKTGTRDADETARAIFEEILERHPHNAAASAGIALSWFNEWSCDFWEDFEANGQRAYDHAHRALAFDDRDPWVHLIIGRILIYRREFARGAWYIDRALTLAPNNAELLIQIVLVLVYLGRPDEAEELAAKAMRLNPYHPNYYHAYAAFPPFVKRDFASAVARAERATGVMIIDIPIFSAIACAHLGQTDQAAGFTQLFEAEFRRKITRGRDPQPGKKAEWLLSYNPFRREEDVALVREGLAMLGTAPGPARRSPSEEQGRLAKRSADLWDLFHGGRTVQMPDLKGLHDLAVLLARPGEAFHCLDLAGRSGTEDRGETVMDERARASVKTKLRELQEELTEAEAMNDIGRAERLRTEMDRLIEALSSALGLGGRSRRMGDQAERARSAVAWRIRHAIGKIAGAHPELGRHLKNSVKTGLFCCYSPERPQRWDIVV